MRYKTFNLLKRFIISFNCTPHTEKENIITIISIQSEVDTQINTQKYLFDLVMEMEGKLFNFHDCLKNVFNDISMATN